MAFETRAARRRSPAPTRSPLRRDRCAAAASSAARAAASAGGAAKRARLRERPAARARTPLRSAAPRRDWPAPPRPAAAPARARPARRCRRATRCAPARQTGTSAPSAAAMSSSAVSPRGACHSAASSLSAAAASLDPPPMPEATGRFLTRVRAAPGAPAEPARRGAAPRATRDCPSVAGPSAAANGPVTRSDSSAARRGRELVADVGERDEAVEQMIAVGAAAEHVEIEIELGRGRERAHHRRAPSAAAHRLRRLLEAAVELGLDALRRRRPRGRTAARGAIDSAPRRAGRSRQ